MSWGWVLGGRGVKRCSRWGVGELAEVMAIATLWMNEREELEERAAMTLLIVDKTGFVLGKSKSFSQPIIDGDVETPNLGSSKRF